jgi:spore germination protein GerM
MSTHHTADSRKKFKQFSLSWRTAAVSSLLCSGAVGLYWQSIHIPRQRSEAIAVQLQELTDSVERLETLLQSSATDSQRVSPTTPAKIVEPQAQSYWLTVAGAEITLVPQPLDISANAEPDVALQTALETLLAGHKDDTDSTTAIPTDTRLLSLEVLPRGIYVDLSNEFSLGGGSSSMITRVAQVLYTATSLDPEAGVFLSVEGQALDETYPLSGEGLVLSQPLTRTQFVKDFPPNLLKTIED